MLLLQSELTHVDVAFVECFIAGYDLDLVPFFCFFGKRIGYRVSNSHNIYLYRN